MRLKSKKKRNTEKKDFIKNLKTQIGVKNKIVLRINEIIFND